MAAKLDSVADEPRTRWFSLGLVTTALVLINIGIYVYHGLHGVPWINPSPDQLLAWGGNLAMRTLIDEGWRLATSMFIHGGLLHLLTNMYMLALIGPLAEFRFGRIGMLLTYLAGGLAASALSASWLATKLVVGVGASGAIMALAGSLLASLAVHALVDELPQSDSGIRKALAQVVGINLFMGFLIPGIDNAAHIGGLVAGLLIGASLELAWHYFFGSVTVTLVRFTVPVMLGAAIAWLTLYASDWSEVRAFRASYEAERQTEKDAADNRDSPR